MGKQHKWYRRGQRIKIILKSGESVIGKFVEQKNGTFCLEGGQRVKMKKMRSSVIYNSDAAFINDY